MFKKVGTQFVRVDAITSFEVIRGTDPKTGAEITTKIGIGLVSGHHVVATSPEDLVEARDIVAGLAGEDGANADGPPAKGSWKIDA